MNIKEITSPLFAGVVATSQPLMIESQQLSSAALLSQGMTVSRRKSLALSHAARCKEPEACQRQGCHEMRIKLAHYWSCAWRETCHDCETISELASFHSKHCEQSNCPVPECSLHRTCPSNGLQDTQDQSCDASLYKSGQKYFLSAEMRGQNVLKLFRGACTDEFELDLITAGENRHKELFQCIHVIEQRIFNISVSEEDYLELIESKCSMMREVKAARKGI